MWVWPGRMGNIAANITRLPSNNRVAVQRSPTVLLILTMVGVINVELSKHHNMVCMAGSIGDPVLLCQWGGSVHNVLLCFLVIHCSCFHLHCIVAIPKLCQPEAAHILQRVDTLDISQGVDLADIHGDTHGMVLDSHSEV